MLTLKYSGVFVGSVDVPGVCVCADSENEAMEIPKMIRDHFELPGLKEPSLCGFERTDDGKAIFLLSVPSVGMF